MGKSKIIAIIITVAIFVGFIAGISNTINSNTTPQDQINESLGTLNNDTWVNLTHDNLVSGSVTVFNESNQTILANNYTINYVTGEFVLNTSVFHNGSTGMITYEFLADDYVSNTAVRALLGVLMIFIFIGLIVAILKMSGVMK